MKKKFYIILLLVISSIKVKSQDSIVYLNYEIKEHVDSFNLWKYELKKDTNSNRRIGILSFKRKMKIKTLNKVDSILPEIRFEIYPIMYIDSIQKYESARTATLSTCYPIAGASIYITQQYVFWSGPFSITASTECGGIDYTRKNAQLIIEQVKKKKFSSIEELIQNLPIKGEIN